MIEQGTTAWLDQRKMRMTGSRIGAILGLSPWQKPADVIREMVREHHGYPSEFVGGPHIDHGNNNEQRAQLAFMRETGLGVSKCGFFEYGDRMGASPDGICSDGATLELKVPFSLRNDPEAQFKPLSDQPHYECQVQMEILAADAPHGWFAQYVAPKGDPLAPDYVPEQIHVERVERDAGWIDRHLPALNAFYQKLMAELENPAHLDPLRVQVESVEAGAILAEIDALRTRQKEDAASEKNLMGKLIELCESKDALVHGRKLTLVKRQGSISYAKAVAELAPDADLEPWRGKESESWRLT